MMAEAVPGAAVVSRADPAVARDVARLAGLFTLLSALYWAGVLAFCGGPGFPLDDAFIHLQFARNLFEGGEMAFNAGVPSSGSTAPAYPLLLALSYALFRDWYLASYVLGALASFGTALAVYANLRTWTGRADIARWGATLTLLSSPTLLQAYSGMEAPFYSLVFLVGLWLYGQPRRRLAASAVLAAGIWFRPEFLSFLPLIAVERAVALFRARRLRPATLAAEVLPHALLWAAMIAVYVGYHWRQDGHLLPSTFAAKAVVHNGVKPDWLDGLPAALRHRHWGHALLALFVWPALALIVTGIGLGSTATPLAFGLKEAIRAHWADEGPSAGGRRLAVLSLAGYPLLRSFVDATTIYWFQGQRYLAHLTPLLVLVVLAAWPATGAVVRRTWWNWTGVDPARQRRRTYAWSAASGTVFTAISVVSVWNINTMQVEMAAWVRRHAPPGALIATNDIGALGFLCDRPILDTVGLVEPGIVRHYLAGGTVVDYLRRHDPAFVVIFPTWYPEFSRRDDLLERVNAIRLRFNIVCGGSEFVAYRPRWKRPAPT